MVLGAIDVLLAHHDIDAKFEWIATALNRLSDWLLRKRLQEFKERVRLEYGKDVSMVELKVPTELTEISHIVRAISWSQV